tara:strand:+ start:473 stop:1489 length:1017 start_codon:yes stop_codon:yes gene_type:complete
MATWSEWWAQKSAEREERRRARAERKRLAEEERSALESAQEYVENVFESFEQERVDIDKKQHHYFPNDLAEGANTGLPFIRFGINSNKGTEKVAIYLHLPPGISVSDGVNYSGFDIGTLRGGIGKVKGMLDDGRLGISESDLFATALIAKDKIVTPGSTVEKITSAAALKAGVATNPYTRTAFETTNVRGYQFSFKMVASNAEESAKIMAIERTFRKFLYPKRMGSIAVVYPPLFHIDFYVEGSKSEYLPKIKPCYLTTLDTTFNSTSSTFHQDTGAPTEVDISLTFQEERTLVRQDLYSTDSDITEADGYYQEASTGGKSADTTTATTTTTPTTGIS